VRAIGTTKNKRKILGKVDFWELKRCNRLDSAVYKSENQNDRTIELAKQSSYPRRAINAPSNLDVGHPKALMRTKARRGHIYISSGS